MDKLSEIHVLRVKFGKSRVLPDISDVVQYFFGSSAIATQSPCAWCFCLQKNVAHVFYSIFCLIIIWRMFRSYPTAIPFWLWRLRTEWLNGTRDTLFLSLIFSSVSFLPFSVFNCSTLCYSASKISWMKKITYESYWEFKLKFRSLLDKYVVSWKKTLFLPYCCLYPFLSVQNLNYLVKNKVGRFFPNSL